MSPKGALLLIAGKADKAKPDEEESKEESSSEGSTPEEDAAHDMVQAIKAGKEDEAVEYLIQTIKACMSSYDSDGSSGGE